MNKSKMLRRSEPTDTLLEQMRRGAAETAAFFTGRAKALRERTAVAGLLRGLGVEHSEIEILSRGPEPIEVWFHDARFQVTEILDDGRPRNFEIKQLSEHLKSAQSVEDLPDLGKFASQPMSLDEIFDLVLKRSQKKAKHYAGEISDTDLLVYVNLKERHLLPSGPLPDGGPLGDLGWRSVSAVTEYYAIVLWAAEGAPAYLHRHKGKAVQWQGVDSIFPLWAVSEGSS